MSILITGAKGFLGKNILVNLLKSERHVAPITPSCQEPIVHQYDLDSDRGILESFCSTAGFIFNFAGVNRPKVECEFNASNRDFIRDLLDILVRKNNRCPIVLSSSTQAADDSPYGLSKREGEKLLLGYSRMTGAEVYIYRFPNVFGKWCRPNYNSAIATFCHNIARNLPIIVNDRSTLLNLVYIDDVVDEMLNALHGRANKKDDGFCYVPITYAKTLGEIVEMLYSFQASRAEQSIPDMSDDFTRKLYATYLSYLPAEGICYPLKMLSDARGSFAELFKTPERGQISVNVTKPGLSKGNHWHNTKNEKFIVVNGSGVVRLRKIGEDVVHEYDVSSGKLEVVEIPPGYTHNIENTGDADLVTLMWASECYNPEKPDTYYEEV